MTGVGPTVEGLFIARLTGQQGAGPQTIAAYRDTWQLLLRHVPQATGKPPQALDFADLTAEVIGGFLAHLEQERGNSVATRNARLAAVHSLFAYAAWQH